VSVTSVAGTPDAMNHRSSVAVLLLVPVCALVRVDTASAEPVPCTTYSIVGTVNEAGEATAYLHVGDEPLVGHEVFVIFAGGEIDVPPTTLVTEGDGRVVLDMPDDAESVVFSAESPISSECSGSGSADPVVVVDQVSRPTNDVVFPPSAGPADVAIAPGIEPVNEVARSGGATGDLAKTGPFSPLLAVIALLLSALGWFARRLRGAPPDHPAGSPRARARVWAGRFARFPL